MRVRQCGAMLENRPARQNGLEEKAIAGGIADPGARIRFFLHKEFRAAEIGFSLHKELYEIFGGRSCRKWVFSKTKISQRWRIFGLFNEGWKHLYF